MIDLHDSQRVKYDWFQKSLYNNFKTLTIYTKYYIRRRGNVSQPILKPRSPIIRVLELLGGEAWPRFRMSHSIVFPWSRGQSGFTNRFRSSFPEQGGVKSEREEPEPIGSTSTSTSSSSSSSFSFTVECPRLTFRARYTFRTRKPRRVRLQTEFACKTRSLPVGDPSS